MTLGGLLFVIVLGGIPMWLALRAWSRYVEIQGKAVAEHSQMLVGFALITLSTAMWMAVLALMSLQDRNSLAKRIAVGTPPAAVGLVNFPFCIGGIVCSRLGRSSAHETIPLRKALASSGWFLMLLWLLLVLNPH
jgi:hypothetical protein